MALITPPRLIKDNVERHQAHIQFGRLLDDVTGEILPNMEIRWNVIRPFLTGFGYEAVTTTDQNGMFSVMLTTLSDEGTFLPTVRGYEVTGWTGGPVRTSNPTNIITGSYSLISIIIRVNKIPQSILVTASAATHGTYENEEWINDSPIVMAPAFPTTGILPTSGRYLYGVENWTEAQLEASGIGWVTADSTLSFDLTTIARADRYFTMSSVISGVSGVTTSPVTTYHIKYDATAPPQSGIADAVGINSQTISVRASGVEDVLSGTDVEHKFINVTSGFTSEYAKVVDFVEQGLTENVSHRVSIQTRDAAKNEATVKISDPIEAVVTFVAEPQPSEVVIGWYTSTSNIGTVNMTSRDFPNRTLLNSGARYRIWNNTDININDTPDEDSGWIQKTDYQFSNIDPAAIYTWGITYRNQDSVETATILTEQSLDEQDITQLQVPNFTHLPSINVPASQSPAIRWGLKLDKMKLTQSIYRVGGIYRSEPYILREPAYQVRLSADVVIPDEFPESNWVKFFISPDDGLTTYPIDPIGMGPNTILTFNSAMTESEKGVAKLLGWSFVDLDTAPSKLTVVIEINRPNNSTFSTPLVYSYDLRVAGVSKLNKNALERGVAPQAKR